MMLMQNYVTNPRMILPRCFFPVHPSPEVNQLAHTDMAGVIEVCPTTNPSNTVLVVEDCGILRT